MIWLGIFFVFFVIWIVVPYVIKRAQIVWLRAYCRKHRLLAFTYDDGPSGDLTERLLDTLEVRGVRASFFILGKKIACSKRAIKRMIQGGHDIGSHSQGHLNAWTNSPFRVYRDIRLGLDAVNEISQSRLFRAPYGKTSLATLIQVYQKGFRQAWWTIDSTDTWQHRESVEAVISRVRNAGGGVILMHDHERESDAEGEAFVLELTNALLRLAEQEGFHIVSLREILE